MIYHCPGLGLICIKNADITNIISKVDGSSTTEYSYNDRNQLVEKVVDNAEKHLYTFDMRGNLIQEDMDVLPSTGAPLVTLAAYVFDGTNKMVSGLNASAIKSSYIYNGKGHLAGKSWPVAKDFVIDYTAAVPVPLTED